MSRLKLWTFVGLVVVAGGANLAFVARWVTERALAQIERELRAAAAQVDARSQLLAADAAQLAEAVARAPAVVQALLAEGEGAAAAATEAAEQSASRVAAEPGRALLVATSGTAGRTVRVQGG